MTLVLFLSAALFYLVPIGVGALIVRLLAITPGFHSSRVTQPSLISRLKQFLHSTPPVALPSLLSSAATLFIPGAAALLGLGLVTSLATDQIPQLSFAPHFFWLSYLLAATGWGLELLQFSQYSKEYYKALLLPLVLSLVTCVIAYGIWQLHAPYPLNWDMYEHQTLSQIILSGHFSFSTAALSDTFGFASYPPTFHTLLALAQFPLTLTPNRILQFWWAISFLHLWTVSLASFVVSWSVTENKTVAYLSMILGTLLFESVVAFTSFFLLPQTVTAVVWAFLLARIYTASTDKKSIALGELLVLLLSLVLYHFVIGSVGAVVLLVTWGFFTFGTYIPLQKHRSLLWRGTVAISALGFMSSYLIDLSSINSGEAAEYAFSFSEAVKYFMQFYSILPMFGILGIWVLYKQKQLSQLHLGLLSVAFTALLLSHFPYSFKFLTLGRFVIITLISIGVFEVLKKNTLRNIVIAGLALSAALTLVLNAHNWQEHIMTGTEARHISEDDIAAAQFLRENYSPQTTMLTDPTTGYLLEGLSGVNSVGGAFATQATREAFYQAGQDGFRTTPVLDLKSISDPVISTPDTTLLVLSGRTFRWLIADETQRLSFNYNIWRPIELSGYNISIIQNILENEPIPVRYSNPSYYIVELPQ